MKKEDTFDGRHFYAQQIKFKRIRTDNDLPSMEHEAHWVTVLVIRYGEVQSARYNKFYGFKDGYGALKNVEAWAPCPEPVMLNDDCYQVRTVKEKKYNRYIRNGC